MGEALPSPVSFKGAVEVLYKGTWHVICDNGWDERDAKVVCESLGW